ncbi:MAG: alanine racemase [Zhaonellaceae bacterium]|jgi:alanine racemase|nr:alanine racemase [Clostridia bacterium]
MRPVWAEIDLKAIDHNLNEVKRVISPSTDMMAIVKANGYGHGAVQVAERAVKAGAVYLGVALLQEAIELRKHGITTPILILGYTSEEDYKLLVKYQITQGIYQLTQAEILNEIAKSQGVKAKVHVKIDTGMGRLGFSVQESVEAIEKIAKLSHVELEGVFSHLAMSDAKDKSYTYLQLEKFIKISQKLEQAGLDIKYKHLANSGGIIDLPETHFNLVRPGIILYGLYPSEEVDRTKIRLKQAMSFKTQISYVKEVPKGTSISYGCTYTTTRTSRIATLPLGYADGYSRLLSNRGMVLVGGKRVPVVGKICMDQFMIDVTEVENVKPGDEVVLFGSQGQEFLSVEEIAELIGTINYEVLCMVSYRVPRRYV